MKTTSTIFCYRSRISAVLIFLLFNLYAFSQPEYDFRNAAVISGVANEVGAVYQFDNVKSGVDARVTILALTGGLYLTDLDGGSGFVEALQPVINIPAHSSGYAELQIDFFYTGTTDPFVQDEVPATPIDIDGYYYGDGFLFEYDMISVGSGYTDFDGNSPELHMSYEPGWVTGTNTSGITYDGIDTLAKQVMFTRVNGHTSSIVVRAGADNQSSSTVQRLRSVYFKKFIYPTYILATSSIVSLKGKQQGDKIYLDWSVSGLNTTLVTLEQSENGKTFKSIRNWAMSEKSDGNKNMNFTDIDILGKKRFYRIRTKSVQGKQEYSNIIYFDNNDLRLASLSLFPTVVSSFATARINSDKTENALYEVFDYSGRVVCRENIQLQSGDNTIRMDRLSKLNSGNYICIIRAGEKTYSSKFQKL